MEELQIFSNAEFGDVRTLVLNNEPWFVGKDVAEVLGYSNPQKAVRDHIDDDDKTLNESFTVNGTQGVLINESGLYSLILSSKLPNAKAFKRWVTSEVLPSIRRTGAYMTKSVTEKALTDPDFLIQLATELKREREERAKMQPAKIFADAVSASNTSILIGELAKVLRQNGVQIGQNRLFSWMREHGYLMKGGESRNIPTQTAMEHGLFEIKEATYINSNGVNIITRTAKVTGKGQIFFINKFLARD